MWVAVHTTVCTLPKYYAQIISAVFPIILLWSQILNFPTFQFSMVLHPGATNVASFSSSIYHIICRILMTMRALSNDIKILKSLGAAYQSVANNSWRRHSCAEVAMRRVLGPYIYPKFRNTIH